MNRTTGFRHLIALVGILATLPTPAHADEQLQVRMMQGVSKDIGPGWNASFDLSERLSRGPDQQLVRVGIEHRLTPRIRIGSGLSYVWSEGRQEWRPSQDITFSLGMFSLRSRLEERFIKDAPRTSVRLRNRLQMSVPITERTRFQVSGELSHHLRAPTPGIGRKLEQWRAAAGVNHALTEQLSATLTYTYIRSVRPGEDRIQHAPGLAIGYDF